MVPKDSRDSAETNGIAHLGGKGKAKAKISRTSSNTSLRDLTPEAIDTGLDAVRRIARIFCYVQTYGEEISNVEDVYGLCFRQKERIDELDTTVNELIFRKDQEMTQLQDENDAYQADARQFEREREELKREQATMDDTRKAMQSEVEKQKEKDIGKAKQEFSDKFKTRAKQIREELEKNIQALEKDNNGLKHDIKELEKKNIQAQEDLNQQKKSLELDKRSFQSHILRLEAELDQANAASTVSPQTPDFYIERFGQLWEGIRDVAVNACRFLPEDTHLLDSDTVRHRLFSASGIFKFSPLSTESPVATFLRACAIQNFLSTKIISIIRRQYFAETTAAVERNSGTQPIDSILDAISHVPAATLSQELSWRLTTVDKLDRLTSHGPSVTTDISTEPSQSNIIEEIVALLHYFQGPTDPQLRVRLTEITSIAVKLWSALRKDSCQVDFVYDPSTDDWQGWDLVDDVATNGSMAASSHSEAQLPFKSYMLFPRIIGSFDSDCTSPRILHTGSALPRDTPVFQTGLQEMKQIDHATKEFKRSLRRGSSAQSSPVIGKRQGDWPAPHRAYN